MKAVVRYGDQAVECDVLETASVASRIRIHVYPGGRVEIEAPPGQAMEEVCMAAQKRARWIFANLKAASDSREGVLQRDYVSGETHFYLGRRYKLIVQPASDRQSSVKLALGRLTVTAYSDDPAVIRRRLRQWYRERATAYFARRMKAWTAILPWVGLEPAFKLSRMATQWGSCSPQGTIHLNPHLIKAPRHCIDYVFVHELCHLLEHNHSKRFYDLLDRHIPAWRDAKAELDSLAELLLVE